MKVPWQKERSTGGETAVQLRSGGRSTFGRLESYVPLLDGETALYREVREAVPVVDAAICKLIRLTGGVRVACGNERAEQGLQRFLREVPVGRGQRGINAFLDCYLDSLLTCGRAVGEIVPDAEGREIAAVLCADVSQVEVREGDNPLEFCLCGVDGGGRSVPLEYQDLLLFTPLNPEMEHPYGVSMLRSMPYLTGLLLKIYDAMGKNWDRCGNVRFAVTYKPQDGELDRGAAQERAEQIAEEWSRAMQEGRNGSVRDLSIKAIGADNQILDSETPVRQILEQLVAKTGLPPFMLGLSWSSTERMSSQQADMLTSEITALRRTLEPVIERVCTLWLRMHGYEQEAMSFPNVAAAKAVGRARGIGTVDVYVSTHAGAPDEKLLGEIEAVLQKKREIAVDVEVKAPTEKTVNMSAELTAEQGWTMQEITDAATAALQAYFTGERLGEAVYTAKLASILYGVEGVKNCHLLTPDEDVSVSATELPVLGTVTITEIGAGEA